MDKVKKVQYRLISVRYSMLFKRETSLLINFSFGKKSLKTYCSKNVVSGIQTLDLQRVSPKHYH